MFFSDGIASEPNWGKLCRGGVAEAAEVSTMNGGKKFGLFSWRRWTVVAAVNKGQGRARSGNDGSQACIAPPVAAANATHLVSQSLAKGASITASSGHREQL